MSETPASPSFSPKRGNKLVSSLVERISPKNNQEKGLRRQNYEKIIDNDPEKHMSLSGGERTSPIRATAECSIFCIDSDDESTNSEDYCRERKLLPKLPSLFPPEKIPANYICPLTLQVMEDPVQDICGHTFERTAILEWLDRSNSHEAVCPISRKPLFPPHFDSSSASKEETTEHDNNDIESHRHSINSRCYDQVLKRNEGLQKRIQEWKLGHPLYQGVDENYEQRQRRKMLRRNTIEIEIIGENRNIHNNPHHAASIECPYGNDTMIDQSRKGDASTNRNNKHADRDGISHHRLSRFELMFLPQEREVMNLMAERSRREQERLNRSQRCLVPISVTCFILIFLLGVYLEAKFKTMATVVDGER